MTSRGLCEKAEEGRKTTPAAASAAAEAIVTKKIPPSRSSRTCLLSPSAAGSCPIERTPASVYIYRQDVAVWEDFRHQQEWEGAHSPGGYPQTQGDGGDVGQKTGLSGEEDRTGALNGEEERHEKQTRSVEID